MLCSRITPSLHSTCPWTLSSRYGGRSTLDARFTSWKRSREWVCVVWSYIAGAHTNPHRLPLFRDGELRTSKPRSRTLTLLSAACLKPKYCAAYPVFGRCARTGFKCASYVAVVHIRYCPPPF